MNTVCPDPAWVGARLMHAPDSRSGSKTWLATEDGDGCGLSFAAVTTALPIASANLITPKASAISSARTSAMRSRGTEPRRRRVRCGTWRAFAIGRAILAGAAPHAYLIRLFTATAAFLQVAVSMLRIARMTMNALFCHTAT